MSTYLDVVNKCWITYKTLLLVFDIVRKRSDRELSTSPQKALSCNCSLWVTSDFSWSNRKIFP